LIVFEFNHSIKLTR